MKFSKMTNSQLFEAFVSRLREHHALETHQACNLESSYNGKKAYIAYYDDVHMCDIVCTDSLYNAANMIEDSFFTVKTDDAAYANLLIQFLQSPMLITDMSGNIEKTLTFKNGKWL